MLGLGSDSQTSQQGNTWTIDFRNIQILSHQARTHRKEAIQCKLEEQMELGAAAGLLEEDHWMMEVNLGLGDMMEATSGEQEKY
jgi:hypothetical protein